MEIEKVIESYRKSLELIKDGIGMLYCCAIKQDIHIGKLKVFARLEVFTANITPACNGNCAIGHNQFVVHAVIDAFESKYIIDHPKLSKFIRIK